MTDLVHEGDAPPSESTGAGTIGPDNLDALEAVMKRIPVEQPPEAEEDAEEESTEEQVPEVEETEEEPAAEEAQEDDLGTELGDLDDEESQWVKENPQSRLAKRIGKLIKRAKTAEEQLETLTTQRQEQEKPAEDDPFTDARVSEDNPFKELETVEDLSKKYGELTRFIDWAEDTLDEHEDALGDDVVYEEGGQEYTKKEVRKRLRQARKEKEQHLPARHREIKDSETAKQLDNLLSAAAKKEIEWIEDDSSEKAQHFKRILEDERIADIMSGPLAGQIRYMAAHALNSPTFMSFEKGQAAPPKPPAAPMKPPKKQTPPASPGGNAAAPSRGKSTMLQELERLEKAYAANGTVDNAVALRTFKNTNNL